MTIINGREININFCNSAAFSFYFTKLYPIHPLFCKKQGTFPGLQYFLITSLFLKQACFAQEKSSFNIAKSLDKKASNF